MLSTPCVADGACDIRSHYLRVPAGQLILLVQSIKRRISIGVDRGCAVVAGDRLREGSDLSFGCDMEY